VSTKKKKFQPAYPNGQTSLDQFTKAWVCPWCGRVWFNPSSLSKHKSVCEKMPLEEKEKIKLMVKENWKKKIASKEQELKELLEAIPKILMDTDKTIKIISDIELKKHQYIS